MSQDYRDRGGKASHSRTVRGKTSTLCPGHPVQPGPWHAAISHAYRQIEQSQRECGEASRPPASDSFMAAVAGLDVANHLGQTFDDILQRFRLHG